MKESTHDKPTIEVRGVTRRFVSGGTHVEALRGVDLDVACGELLMLVGPSGCGKTTLISIMSGILAPTSGSARVIGVDWAELSNDRRTARRGELFGFVFQQFHLIPTLTAVENVAAPLMLRGVRRHEALGRAGEALANVALAERAHARPSELSGGMQQRVSVARALAGRPHVLICDEPTANLDHEAGRGVMELIRQSVGGRDASGRRRCAVVVTHDTRVMDFASRIVLMDDGRLRPQPTEAEPPAAEKRAPRRRNGRPAGRARR